MVGLNATAGAAVEKLIINDPFAIQIDSHMTIDEGEYVAVPFAARFAGVLEWLDATEDGSRALNPLHATVAVYHLSLRGRERITMFVAIDQICDMLIGGDQQPPANKKLYEGS